jgi:hypothetical protein
MNESIKTVKQVCKCENCGNEAEMVVTCTLQETDAASPEPAAHDHNHAKSQIKGTGTCSTCGNEADVWVDL